MEKNRGLTNVLLSLCVVIGLIALWMLNDIRQNLLSQTSTQQNAVQSISPIVTPEPKEELKDSAPAVYVVVRGDILSCIAPKNWREIAKLNALKNPDLIFPGQELKLLPGTEIRGGCKAKRVQLSPGYCRIGADPVNPNRELAAFEHEHHLQGDVLAVMGTGSGKTVECTLRAGEIVVTEDFPTKNGDIERVATWVRKCGNPILNEVVVATIKPTQPEKQKEALLPESQPQKSTGGLIILKTFEGRVPESSQETVGSEGILRDSEGNPVVDSSGNPVKTDR